HGLVLAAHPAADGAAALGPRQRQEGPRVLGKGADAQPGAAGGDGERDVSVVPRETDSVKVPSARGRNLMPATTQPRTFRWTREQFHNLRGQGYFQNKPVEPIDGEIIEMPVPKPPHVMSMGLTEDALRVAFGVGYWIRTQSPLNLSEATDAEPDVAVVSG